MADGMSADFSQLDALAADLGVAAGAVAPFARKAAEVTSRLIKDDAKGRVGGSWRGAGRAIDYEVKDTADGPSGEIGYNKGKAGGPLGNLREFGAPGAPGRPLAPHHDLQNALEANQADFVRGMEKAVGDAFKRGHFDPGA